MCGISGKLYFYPEKVGEKLIVEMNKSLTHRGPDDTGIFVNGPVGLGHCRLSVIDLSKAGHQPMSDPDRKVWISYNGEIYNFKKLRENLIKKGYKFRSGTDTEVLIYLYKEYGRDCLQYLRGMFAFAIWDEEKRELFLARDRLGQKPLKYFINNKFVIFASELKAVFKDPAVRKEPDLEAIHHYLSFQYAPSPMTGFADIKKLPPASYMVIKANGESEIKKYWQPDFREKWNLTEKEWSQKILDKLEEATRLRMVSDVPLGTFLSGGIDSSAIVLLLNKFSSKPVKTFSIGFPNKSYDETSYARRVARQLKTEHKEFCIEPKALEILPELVRHYEEPYADSSAIPTWYLSEMTRKFVTVALNGDGGDENFAGYTRYNAYKLFLRYASLPRSLRKIMRPLGKFWAQILISPKRREKATRFLDKIDELPEKSYLELISYFNQNEKNQIYSEEFRKRITIPSSLKLKEQFTSVKAEDPLDRVMAVDFNTYLPDDLLVKVDIASMAHSLETRSPFLDHEFIELTAKIPSELKLKGMTNKYILKKSLSRILPKEILNRKKMGFGVPLEHWFRNELKEYAYGILLSSEATERGFFKKEEIKNLLDKHQTTKVNYANHIWALLYLELWFRKYF